MRAKNRHQGDKMTGIAFRRHCVRGARSVVRVLIAGLAVTGFSLSAMAGAGVHDPRVNVFTPTYPPDDTRDQADAEALHPVFNKIIVKVIVQGYRRRLPGPAYGGFRRQYSGPRYPF